jgi:hypothetical protein
MNCNVNRKNNDEALVTELPIVTTLAADIRTTVTVKPKLVKGV